MSLAIASPSLAARPACTEQTELFQHPLLEGDAPASATDRRMLQSLTAQASAACAGCPLATECLYRAVVECDVAGYVAGTTAPQRTAMRRLLGIRVSPETLDSFIGASRGAQLDSNEVARLRAANPAESLQVLAGRLGCSLSTVKRHLRRARATAGERGTRRASLSVVAPTRQQVLAAREQVRPGSSAARRRVA